MTSPIMQWSNYLKFKKYRTMREQTTQTYKQLKITEIFQLKDSINHYIQQYMHKINNIKKN